MPSSMLPYIQSHIIIFLPEHRRAKNARRSRRSTAACYAKMGEHISPPLIPFRQPRVNSQQQPKPLPPLLAEEDCFPSLLFATRRRRRRSRKKGLFALSSKSPIHGEPLARQGGGLKKDVEREATAAAASTCPEEVHIWGESSWTENGRKELSSSSFTLSLLPVGLLVPHFLPLLLLPSAQAGFPPKKGKRQAAKRGQFFLGRGDEGTLHSGILLCWAGGDGEREADSGGGGTG